MAQAVVRVFYCGGNARLVRIRFNTRRSRAHSWSQIVYALGLAPLRSPTGSPLEARADSVLVSNTLTIITCDVDSVPLTIIASIASVNF